MSRFLLTSRILRPGLFVTAALMTVVLLPFQASLLGRAMAQSMELPQRTWTDSTGKFTIEASLVAFDDGNVSLKKSDGRVVVLPLERLSQTDQAVATAMSQLLSPQDDNPFAGGTLANPLANPLDSSGGPVEPAAGVSKLVKTDWSSARQVAMTAANRDWSFAVEAPPAPASDNGGRAIPLPPTSDFFDKPVAIAMNERSRRAVIGYIFGRPGNSTKTSRLVLCDLAKGQAFETAGVPGEWIPLALNDNGIQVLMRRNEFGFGKSDELELWNIGSSGVSKGIKWIPYDSLERSDRDVSWAAFLDNGRVATVNGSGHLVVWDVDTARPIYRLSTASRGVPALSPDRKHLAFVAAGQIGVLDVAKGKVVALRRSPERSAFPRLCFSPSGARLAYKDAGKLYVWDFATGELSYEVSMKQFSGNEAILAPSEEHVLVKTNYLIDLKSGAKLWKYDGHALADSLGGICWFVLSERDKGPGALVPLVLPQPGVMETLEQAMADPDFLVLKPGVTVKLNVDGLPVAADREKARAQLTEKLSTLGFKVDSNGTIELVATLEFGEPEEISYRSFGFGFSGPPGSSSGTGKFRPYTFRLKFIYQEQTAWQTLGGQTSAPYSLDLKEGETIATALRRLEKPDYSFFERVELPESLMKPTGNSSGTLGSSSITAYGLE